MEIFESEKNFKVIFEKINPSDLSTIICKSGKPYIT